MLSSVFKTAQSYNAILELHSVQPNKCFNFNILIVLLTFV